MQPQQKYAILLPERGGFFCCPYCDNRLLRIDARTDADNLPVYCKKCRRELRVDIHKSQSRLSQSL